MAQAPLKALQLYGIVTLDPAHDQDLPPGTSVVPFRDLGALVSEAPYVRPRATPEAVAAYHRVIEVAFASRVVVPAPFGTVFRARDGLVRWLELHYFTLMEAVSFLEDRAEARVSVSGAADVMTASTEELAMTATEATLRATASESFRVLRRHAVASLTVQPSSTDGETVLRSAFLVEKERWTVFQDIVREEQQRNPGLRIETSGPWPPYDFVHMQFGG